MNKENNENINCPACGYLCLGKGGFGCIKKPSYRCCDNGNFEDDHICQKVQSGAVKNPQEGSEYCRCARCYECKKLIP